jgi:hypothetical protein
MSRDLDARRGFPGLMGRFFGRKLTEGKKKEKRKDGSEQRGSDLE